MKVKNKIYFDLVRNFEIQLNNKFLLQKLKEIDESGSKINRFRKPAFSCPKFKKKYNFISSSRKFEIIRVAQENQHLFKRLQERSSFYDVSKWEKDYEKAQYYKQNHCVFPSIDFANNSMSRFFGQSNGFNKTTKSFQCSTGYIRKTNYNKFKFRSQSQPSGISQDNKNKSKNLSKSQDNISQYKDKELVKILYETKTYISELGQCLIQFSVQTQK